MEPGKKSNSETSSTNADQDDDHQALQVDQEKAKEESMGIRSYECTFCKRGFTNAQALGGHMNIHRKDKAKAKANKHTKNIHDQVPAAASFMDKNIKYSGYFPAELISSHHPDGQNLSAAGYYQLLNNYQVYLQPSSNPSPQIGNDTNRTTNHEPVLRMDLFGNDVDVDGNQLNLRIGLTTSTSTSSSPPVEEQNVKENEELDLELRLGQDP